MSLTRKYCPNETKEDTYSNIINFEDGYFVVSIAEQLWSVRFSHNHTIWNLKCINCSALINVDKTAYYMYREMKVHGKDSYSHLQSLAGVITGQPKGKFGLRVSNDKLNVSMNTYI